MCADSCMLPQDVLKWVVSSPLQQIPTAGDVCNVRITATWEERLWTSGLSDSWRSTIHTTAPWSLKTTSGRSSSWMVLWTGIGPKKPHNLHVLWQCLTCVHSPRWSNDPPLHWLELLGSIAPLRQVAGLVERSISLFAYNRKQHWPTSPAPFDARSVETEPPISESSVGAKESW